MAKTTEPKDPNTDIDTYDEQYRDLPLHPLATLLGAPTDTMCDAGRTAVMARDCSGPKWPPSEHYRASGHSTRGIPEDLLKGGTIPKEQGALLVWYTMLAHLPETFGPEPETPLSGIQFLDDSEAKADVFLAWIKHKPSLLFDRRLVTFMFEWANQNRMNSQFDVPEEDFSHIAPPDPLSDEQEQP